MKRTCKSLYVGTSSMHTVTVMLSIYFATNGNSYLQIIMSKTVAIDTYLKTIVTDNLHIIMLPNVKPTYYMLSC